MIKRQIFEDIKKWVGKDKIIILKGARQVGKTTLMKELETYLLSNDKKTVFLQADKISNIDIFETPDDLIGYLSIKHNFPDNYIYLFIDEFQYIKNAGLFLKNIFDEYKNRLQIIVSGSSSLDITKNSEFLTGRAINFYIDRISFFDYFIFKEDIKKLDKYKLDNFSNIEQFYNIFNKKLNKYFLEYLTYGAYPEVLNTKNIEDKKTILSGIIEMYIQKDIINFLGIEDIRAFNNLIKVLSSNIGNLVNINELSSTLNVSMQTINKYLDILEGTFIFSRVSPFFKNTRKELTKMPKIFVEDISIKNYSLNDFDSIKNKLNIGQEIENFVYNELSKTIDKRLIYFYRTKSKAEIDFVIEHSYENYSIIEVKYKNRIIKPVIFDNFAKSYNTNKKIIITKDLLFFKNEIYYIPACLLAFIEI